MECLKRKFQIISPGPNNKVQDAFYIKCIREGVDTKVQILSNLGFYCKRINIGYKVNTYIPKCNPSRKLSTTCSRAGKPLDQCSHKPASPPRSLLRPKIFEYAILGKQLEESASVTLPSKIFVQNIHSGITKILVTAGPVTCSKHATQLKVAENRLYTLATC